MKLTRQSILDALCPVCALGGIPSPLKMSIDSLAIRCINGHIFDTVELSKLAARVGKRDQQVKD